MSFFDEIQPKPVKKGASSSFFPDVGTSVKPTVKTPITSNSGQSAPLFTLPTQSQSISFNTPSQKTQTSTPMFSSPIKSSLPTSTTPFAPPPANASFFDKVASEQKQTAPQKQESFFDTILKKPSEIYSAKPQSKLGKFFDEKAPKIIKDIASQISEGLYGTGQQVDFAGNLKEDTGLISGLFGSIKSDYARVGDRYDKLIEKGVTPERATSIATQYTKNSLSNPLAYINNKKVQDETIKSLNLTSEEKSALRTVGFFETINTALDALNFTGIGSIGKKTFQTIAKETYPLAIKNILKKEIANIPESTADQLSRILAKVNDEDAVEKIISKVDFSINKYKPPAPLADDVAKTPIKEIQPTPPVPKAPIYEGEKDLTISTLEKLKDRSSVSKQFISDLSNASDLKQTERDIIRETLDTFPEGSVIPVKEFAEKVKTGLLPLKVASPESMARYETITLPEEQRGLVDSYYENIYDSPIKTSAGNIHFGESPMGDEGGVENYFGHTRIEDMADNNTRRVIEVQSDLYQKGNLEREKPSILADFEPALTEDEMDTYRALSSEKSNLKLKTESEAINKRIDEINKETKPLQDKMEKYKASRNKEVSRLAQYSNPTAHFRMVREEIKKAAQDGKTKLQFPTGETAMKI